MKLRFDKLVVFLQSGHMEKIFLEKMSPFTKHIDGRAMGADILCTAQTNLELQTVVISLADIWDFSCCLILAFC